MFRVARVSIRQKNWFQKIGPSQNTTFDKHTTIKQHRLSLQGTPCRFIPSSRRVTGGLLPFCPLRLSRVLRPLSKISNPHTNHCVRDLWGALTFTNKVNAKRTEQRGNTRRIRRMNKEWKHTRNFLKYNWPRKASSIHQMDVPAAATCPKGLNKNKGLSSLINTTKN